MIAILLDCPGEPMTLNLTEHSKESVYPSVRPARQRLWGDLPHRPPKRLRVPFQFPPIPAAFFSEGKPIVGETTVLDRTYRRVGTYLSAEGEVAGLYMPVCAEASK